VTFKEQYDHLNQIEHLLVLVGVSEKASKLF
jgi:hypothetical protein